MLIRRPRLILDSVVDGFAETAFSLTTGLPCLVNIKELNRFERVAQQAMLEALCLPNIIVMENNKFPFFDFLKIFLQNQSIVEEFRFAPGCMGEVAGATYDFEVGSKLAFSCNNELSTVASQALKSLENNVAHPLDM